MTKNFTIGQIAVEARLRASAIRFYERAGLLPKPLRAGGQRRYDNSVLRQLAVLEFAKDCGFTLAEIRQLFCGFKAAAPLSERLRNLARRKIDELDATLHRVSIMKHMLERAQHCHCLDFDECAEKILARRVCSPEATTNATAAQPKRPAQSKHS